MSDHIHHLINKVKAGDHDAFAKIVDLYKGQVYNICLRLIGIPAEAEDIAQESFIRAYTNIERFETDKKFSTWLFKIATNLCIDYLRKKKPGASLDAELPGTDGYNMYAQLAASDPSPEEQVAASEMSDWLHAEIRRLPPKYRSAIVLKYVEDLSLKEISEILDIPVPTVKTRIHRGREALRKRLVRDRVKR